MLQNKVELVQLSTSRTELLPAARNKFLELAFSRNLASKIKKIVGLPFRDFRKFQKKFRT
jgi:hypothetical protein